MSQVPRGVDIFNLESLLTSEEAATRDLVRQFINDEFTPSISENWRLGKFPKELALRMGELGLLGAHLDLPGRAPVSKLAAGIIYRELERGDTGIRSFASVQGCLVMEAITRYGTDEQKQKWIPELAAGKAIGAFAIAEPEHGSDPNQMSTTAVLSNDNYIISGKKTWTTNGSIADVIVLWARTEHTLQGFLIEPSVRGFTANDIRGKHGMRICVQSELTFDNCTIHKSAALPGATGLKSCLKLLNIARYAIAWGAVGAAEACFEEAFQHVKTRESFGKPVASFQLVQEKIADMATSLSNAQLAAYNLARLADNDSLTHLQISMAKRGNIRAALEVSSMARDLLGANGMCDSCVAFRHMANLTAQSTTDGTDHIHSLIIGQALTGYGAYV